MRPPGQDTTYTEAGGPPVNTGLFNLYFDSSNWDQWQTINLNIHCADHEDDKAYIVQNWVRLPGDTFSCRDGNQSTNCDHSTWHDVRVNVIDTKSSAEPADLSVDTAYDGVLSAEPFPYPPLRYCVRGGECEWRLGIQYRWTTTDATTVPPTRNPNDLLDATRHFSSFRIRLEGDSVVSGATADPQLPVSIYNDDPSIAFGHTDSFNSDSRPYYRDFQSGLFTPQHSTTNPGDPVYRITITPVTLRGNEVPGEAVTMCVQLQSPAGWPTRKDNVRVDCSLFTPPANDVPVIQRAFSRTAQDGQGSGPEVTLASDIASVTEGDEVTFTISASPTPAEDVQVLFSMTEKMGSGDDLIARGSSEFLTIPAGQGSVAVTVNVYSDDDGRADGTVFAEVVGGDGYTLGDPASVTLALLDDDGGAPPDYTDYQTVVDYLIQVRDDPENTSANDNPAHILKWNRVLAAIGYDSGEDPMPASEIHENAEKWPDSAFKAASDYLNARTTPPPPTPEVNIAGSIGGSEGVSVTEPGAGRGPAGERDGRHDRGLRVRPAARQRDDHHCHDGRRRGRGRRVGHADAERGQRLHGGRAVVGDGERHRQRRGAGLHRLPDGGGLSHTGAGRPREHVRE
ncbi:MAG: hypothetical protein OXP28_07055 [Gammaproteobacteria bacterium]|nr:hypothetical protein [Gammaproteobacteria bacterium]